MTKINRSNKRGFTLIELLIVIAIIAILAAIAIPNFLAAQTRSKVSRAKAEMRSIASALEAYYVDYNRYVPYFWRYSPLASLPVSMRLSRLTTPVAYMTKVPMPEPFRDRRLPAAYDTYDYVDEQTLREYNPQIYGNTLGAAWRINSAGPDTWNTFARYEGWTSSIGCPPEIHVPWYDPTNGIVSNGDIVRVGGVGNWWRPKLLVPIPD